MLRLDVDALVTAAAGVTGHGEDLAARQLAADNRIAAAAPGWTGRSAAALQHRMSQWVASSALVLTRVGAHATDLQSGAVRFAVMDEGNSTLLDS